MHTVTLQRAAISRESLPDIREIRLVVGAEAWAAITEAVMQGGAVTQSLSSDGQALVDRLPIRRHDPVAQRLKQRAADVILNGTSWLTSREVGVRADPAAANPHSLTSRWLSQGRVFAIEHRGQKVFPDYAFDLLGHPVVELREVLKILSGCSALRIASWFESRSSRLDGRKPRELLASQPGVVIDAARAHMAGPLHG
ncbi:hypothetical protein [Sphaerotilus sp.]|jgi:hypothetical protein|uniref:hypothetical protein n=1 Tax=Sphaerotilus sp. TaxID=2093942 RepID=UPI0025EDB9C4|nr:hypothetical protein [Sphaerotilus sp.]